MTGTMGEVRIEIRVDTSGRMRPRRRDTQQIGPQSQVMTAGLDRDIIRLFEGWLRLRDRRWREVEIRTFGSLLHRFLFAERDSWNWIDGVIREIQPAVVNLELVFPADGEYARLAAVPWEYLYRPEEPGRAGTYLAGERNLVLSRYIPRTEGRPALPEKETLHVLAVVSQPEDPMLGDVESEDVLAKIQQTAVALNWSLEVLDMPTEKNVKDRLFSGTTPDIVHFMGHGRFDTEDGEASLALVNPTGGTDWVPDRRLAQIMTRGDRAPSVVVLHACDGGVPDFPLSFAGVAPQLARNGVPNVVAMQYEVTNQTAIDFSTNLYQNIADGDELHVAVQGARWQIGDDPVMLGRPVIYRQATGALLTPGAGP